MELEINLWSSYCVMFTVIGTAGIVALLFVWYSRDRRSTGLPLGTLGWPFIGETLEFISCGYSSRPESFMDKRRILIKMQMEVASLHLEVVKDFAQALTSQD